MAGANQVIRNLNQWADRQAAAVVALAENWAGELEARAKPAAPWHDQTGDARKGLFGRVVIERNMVKILLAHSVEYGVFL